MIAIRLPGYMSLAQARAAGADMTLAVSRWVGEIPKEMYAASAPPAMVANPPVITECISELVILGKKGLIRSGDSVWPRKMLAAQETDSQAVVPTVI